MPIYTKRGIHFPLLTLSEEVIQASSPFSVGVYPSSFRPDGFIGMVQEGDSVLIGSPILRHVSLKGLYIVSPVAGHIHHISYEKGCRPHYIEIFLSEKQDALTFDSFLNEKDPFILVQEMGKRGLLTCIRSMPCDVLPDPSKLPRSIFVKAIESAPGCVSPFVWLSPYWNDFILGLRLLQRICPDHLHVISDSNSLFSHKEKVDGAHYHEAIGPHPIGNGAIHIHALDPITSLEESIWILSVRDVVAIGKHALEGRYWSESFFSIFHPEKSLKYSLVKSVLGVPARTLLASVQDRSDVLDSQIISGDVFSGKRIGADGFLRLQDNCLTLLEKKHLSNLEVVPSFFFRKTRFFFSPDGCAGKESFPFDHAVYERVLPMNLPLVHLLRACWANDLEEAVLCGLLEISLEEAALFSAICPAHFDFVSLFEKALLSCYNDVFLRR